MKTKSIFFIFILFFIISCGIDKEFQQKEISGIIIKKYRHSNHDLPMIVLNDNTEIDITAWSRGNNYFWEFAVVGDSLYKASGSMDLKVIKKKFNSVRVFKYEEIPSRIW